MEKSAKKTKNSQQNPESTPAPTPAPTPTPPGNLGVQTGRDCSIEIQAQGSGNYTLRATVGNVTVLFAERPVRMAGTVATSDFVARFDELFASSNPNAALTFTGDDRKVRRNNILGEFSEPEPDATGNNHNNNNGPLIVVLSQPRMVGSSSTIIEYNMTQSASQGEVASIDQFLGTSSASCSIFIDSTPWWNWLGDLEHTIIYYRSISYYFNNNNFTYSFLTCQNQKLILQ